MSWDLKKFSELDINYLYEILKLRVEVFVVEQNCPYPELDNYDQHALHLSYKENNEIIAYCRIIPGGHKYEECSIGRVIVKEHARGRGLARILMLEAIEKAERTWNVPSIRICAQSHLQKFYHSVGFHTISNEFEEDGIPHVYMMTSKN
ncbi:GNAT family N-acetyltransferase [Psychrobacillus sp. AK 1817]|uniref:GNAT family N-acetyltransferase n=1 Tax=Psychrobacillus sp. AK 1817 TaxID=2303505 RepID=UPI0011A7F49E|nr:GNAT family N-acetyltransferase [Psychrobacillus sp. AK 1817]QEY21892.1 GNAT family N-acetyltransferase [Psychrobacillus sp. AK 1817]